jgi:hypothetical protein
MLLWTIIINYHNLVWVSLVGFWAARTQVQFQRTSAQAAQMARLANPIEVRGYWKASNAVSVWKHINVHVHKQMPATPRCESQRKVCRKPVSFLNFWSAVFVTTPTEQFHPCICRNEVQVSNFLEMASSCNETDIISKLGNANGVARLTEICEWPQGFSTSPMTGKLSFQRSVVPMLKLITKDSVRNSTRECNVRVPAMLCIDVDLNFKLRSNHAPSAVSQCVNPIYTAVQRAPRFCEAVSSLRLFLSVMKSCHYDGLSRKPSRAVSRCDLRSCITGAALLAFQ